MSGETLSPAPNEVNIKDRSCDHGTWEGPEGKRLTWWEKMTQILNPFGHSPDKIQDYRFQPDDKNAYDASGGHDQSGTMKIKLK